MVPKLGKRFPKWEKGTETGNGVPSPLWKLFGTRSAGAKGPSCPFPGWIRWPAVTQDWPRSHPVPAMCPWPGTVPQTSRGHWAGPWGLSPMAGLVTGVGSGPRAGDTARLSQCHLRRGPAAPEPFPRLSHLRHRLCPSPMPHSVGGVVQMGVPKSGSALRGLLLSPALAHPLPACGRPLAGWMRRETEARCWHVCVGFCQPQPFPLCSRRTARVRVPHPGQGWPGLSGCLGGRSVPCPSSTIWGR